jgi:hypothetical protein
MRTVIYAVKASGFPALHEFRIRGRGSTSRRPAVIYVRDVIYESAPSMRTAQSATNEGATTSMRVSVMYGRPPLGKGFFRRFGKRIRCGHVSGLYARYMDRWP